MNTNDHSLTTFDYNNKTFIQLMRLQYENFSKIFTSLPIR